MESYWAHGIADHEMGPENGRWWFWRTWMLVVDPHVCGKKVVGFHLFCWIMVQIHGQNSIVCDSVQYCSECVFVKNPLAHCFRAVWVYRLKVYIYELFQHRWFHTQNSQPLGPLLLPKACQMPQKLSSLMPWAQMPHAMVLQLIGGFMASYDFGWKNMNCLVVWNMALMTFHLLGIIIPTDYHIFQRGWNHQPVNIAIENGTFIVDWPIKNGGKQLVHGCSSPHSWEVVFSTIPSHGRCLCLWHGHWLGPT